MTLIYREIPDVYNKDEGMIATVRIVGKHDIQLFKQLVNRAMNCWDTAPAELKEFGDMVTEGKLQQNYSGRTDFAKKQVDGQ